MIESNPTRLKSRSLRTCITCGEETVSRRTITVQRLDGRSVPGVRADICRTCGEQYFDIEAMRKIEAASAKVSPKRRRAA
ncbi:MAG: YgiT-type zinc finger protein [Phycisphaerales bacterium]